MTLPRAKGDRGPGESRERVELGRKDRTEGQERMSRTGKEGQDRRSGEKE